MTRLRADDIDVERGLVDTGMVAGMGAGMGVGIGTGIDAEAGTGIGRVEGPVRFHRLHGGRRSYTVLAVLDHWVEAGDWWRRTGRSQRGAPVGIDDGEREVWRVEARQLQAGRDAPVGVFDLNFDWSAGRWSLIRVHD